MNQYVVHNSDNVGANDTAHRYPMMIGKEQNYMQPVVLAICREMMIGKEQTDMQPVVLAICREMLAGKCLAL